MGVQFLNGGILTTIQDLGRYGFQEIGMSVSGVMDVRSASLANILVGNEEGEGVLEVTMMGPTMKFTEDNIIAITGGDLGAKIDGVPAPRYEAFLVKAGQTLSFMGMFGGSRAYVAFSGGLDVPMLMGSKSTNLKSKIGGFEGRKIGAGDEITFSAPKAWLPNMEKRQAVIPDFSAKEHVLRVIMGPQDDAFTKKGIETFLSAVYTITNEYDRMGCRMEGEVIEHKEGGDIITDGLNFGAVQVPSHGNPIVMMADHQTTGGYTKIANVISVDLPILAQCMPGHKIRFEKVSIEEAQDLFCAEKAGLKALKEALNAKAESVLDVQAAALAAVMNADRTYWSREGTYRVIVNGEEFLVDLEKELPRFR